MQTSIKGIPCPACGWKLGGQHVCPDPSLPWKGEGLLLKKGVVRRPMSDEQKQKISEGQRRRWSTFRRES